MILVTSEPHGVAVLSTMDTQHVIQGLIVLGRTYPNKQADIAPLVELMRDQLGMDPHVDWRRLGGWDA